MVKWKTAKPLYSVLPMADFVKVDSYILEQDYSVRYNDGRGLKKFKTQLLLIGSKEECDEHERTIIEYGIDEGVDSNKSKAQSSKAKQTAIESIRQITQDSLHSSENLFLKEKLKDYEFKLKESETKIANLESKLQNQETSICFEKLISYLLILIS